MFRAKSKYSNGVIILEREWVKDFGYLSGFTIEDKLEIE